jgi:non-specific serine/threonine protein kinase/serine/threonine-protein kinase
MNLLTPAELADVEAIFTEAADMTGIERRALLDARCEGRPHLRVEIEALLNSHDHSDGFLGVRADDHVIDGVEDQLRPGARVGAYELVEKIGEGGMGDVYLAERVDGQFAHRVAIKVARVSLRTREAARRVRAERQILASLQHPNIVTLLDAGVTPVGEAYLVMEHVGGVPITRYCRERSLTLEARLALVRQVATAVQFAHRHGIVHRDLKPANILVTAEGVPKVLDFGVAKLLEAPAGAEATLTRAFPGPLTPNYASPEQLRGLPLTTASDVYALGVLAYEILADARPYDTVGKTLDEVLAIVLDADPPRPSAVRSPATEASAPYPRSRLKGDLDAIVLKAMSKDPLRRYGSAAELSDDLERFLAGHPVVAREPSMGYVFRRLASRNKAATTIAAAAVIAILGALGVAMWQRDVAVKALARAEQRSAETRQLANALIFKIHDAVVPLPGSTPVRQTIVSEALGYLERLERDSEGDASLQLDLSRAYRQIGFIQGNPNSFNLGNRDEALKHYQSARRLGAPLALAPGASASAISNLVNVDLLLADLEKRRKGPQAAAAYALEAVQQARRVVALTGETSESRTLLGRALFGLAMVEHPAPTSGPLWEQALRHYERELTREAGNAQHARNVALVAKYLGSVYESADENEKAIALYQRALELDERRYAADPSHRLTQFDLSVSLSTLATATERQKRYDEAAELYARSLAIRRQLSASDPKDILSRSKVGYAQVRLASTELRRGRVDESRTLALEAVDILQEVVSATGDKSARRELGSALSVLASTEQALQRHARACDLFQRAGVEFQAAPDKIYLETIESATRAALRQCQGTK